MDYAELSELPTVVEHLEAENERLRSENERIRSQLVSTQEERERVYQRAGIVAIEAFRVATKRSHKKRAMIAWAGAAGIRAASALLAAAIMVDICGGGRESMEQIEKQAAFRVLKGGKP